MVSLKLLKITVIFMVVFARLNMCRCCWQLLYPYPRDWRFSLFLLLFYIYFNVLFGDLCHKLVDSFVSVVFQLQNLRKGKDGQTDGQHDVFWAPFYLLKWLSRSWKRVEMLVYHILANKRKPLNRSWSSSSLRLILHFWCSSSLSSSSSTSSA